MPYIILLHTLFALTFTVGKKLLQYGSPFFITAVRMLFAGVLILTFLYFKDRQSIRLNKTLWLPLILTGIFNVFLTNAFEFWGMQYMSSSKTCFIYSLSPFIAALLSYWAFQEKLTAKKWLGLIVSLLGISPVLLKATHLEAASGKFFIFTWAELAMVVAAFATSYGWIIMRKLVHVHHISPLYVNGFSMVVGGLISLVFSGIFESWQPVPVKNYLPFTGGLLLLMLISNFICYNLYGHLLKKFTASLISLVGFIEPLIVATFGWIFLNEHITSPFIFGSLILFLGIYLFYQEELKLGYLTSGDIMQKSEQSSEDSRFSSARKHMLQTQMRDVTDPKVLAAMGKVPRHLFVSQADLPYAYQDFPLPIDEGQTISQPYIVALMTELLQTLPNQTVLEIGTGCGYQTAILAELGCQVYTIEIKEKLSLKAQVTLSKLNYQHIKYKVGDGYNGWKEHAPYDRIIVTAGAKEIPAPLLEQLKDGGRMVIPVGDLFFQKLLVITKQNNQPHITETIPVRFVPLQRN